ncbi:MAG TPA: glutathionylspermidine synthase family protein [Polyangia bacterium]
MTYADFAAEMMRTSILSDPWLDGVERFRLRGLVLPAARDAALRTAAEGVGLVLEELAAIVWREPALLDEYFRLTPYQKLMWYAARGAWHGIARADLFELEGGGIACCEVNSDTPSGQAECVLLNRLLVAEHPAATDPNVELHPRFVAMVRAAHGRPVARVGILYPTEFTEDLSMIALYRQWLEAEGIAVVLGSPFNLGLAGGRLTLMGEPIDAMIRHYKTDWWGERLPAWYDQEPFPDAEPLDQQLAWALDAAAAGTTTIINPFGAVITQNKLGLAYMHEHKDRFSAEAQAIIDAHIPETRRLIGFDRAQLRAERADWVLKSDYGCEGAETLVGAFTSETEWHQALEMAIPERWVAQRFFRVLPDEAGELPNIGVYLVGGVAAGFYTRLSTGATNYRAKTAPTFVTAGARA